MVAGTEDDLLSALAQRHPCREIDAEGHRRQAQRRLLRRADITDIRSGGHGRLLDPGVTTVALEPGRYFFKTLSDTHLRVVTGGVSAGITAHIKNPWPDPEVNGSIDKGDEIAGERPRLTVE